MNPSPALMEKHNLWERKLRNRCPPRVVQSPSWLCKWGVWLDGVQCGLWDQGDLDLDNIWLLPLSGLN